MGGFLGLGKSKSKSSSQSDTTTNSTTNGTQSTNSAVTLPGYMQPGVEGYYNNVNGLVAQAADPNWAASLVPGATSAQQAAYDAASGPGIGDWKTTLGDAVKIASTVAGNPAFSSGGAPTVVSQSLLDNLGSYMSPYTDAVVNTTLAGMDQQAGKDAAALTNQGGLSKAFGNSRFGLATTNLQGQQELNRAQTEAGLRDTAFNTGAGLSNLDTDRRQGAQFKNADLTMQQKQLDQAAALAKAQNDLSAAGLMGQIGVNQGEGNRADIATQLAAGQDQRAVQTEQAQAPFALDAFIQSLLGINGDSLLGRSSTTDTSESSNGTTNTATKGKTSGISVSAGIK